MSWRDNMETEIAATDDDDDDDDDEVPEGAGLEWHASLEGSDCETCGYNFESVDVEARDGEYWYRVRVGCYGGTNFASTDLDEFVAKLREETPWLVSCGMDTQWMDQVISELTAAMAADAI